MRKAYFGLLFTIYVIALVICCGIRGYLSLTGGINAVTGFYSGSRVLVSTFNLVLLGALLSWTVMTVMRRPEHEYPLPFKGASVSVSLVLTAAAILLCAAADVYELRDRMFYGIVPAPNTSFYLAVGISRLNLIMMWIKLALAALAAIGLVLLALRRDIGRLAFLGVFPALWQLAAIYDRYISYMAPSQISENMLSILFMAIAPVFLLGQARAICGFKQQNSRNLLVPAGLAVSLIGFTYALPKLALLALDYIDLAFGWELAFTIYSFVLAICAIIYLVKYSRAIKIA